MKENARGPFSSIKWFCKDGRVLAPKDYACAKRGEGWQHGEWSDRTKELRSKGYKVATLLAGMDATAALAAPDFADTYAQLLIEKFLFAADDGWIMRKAQFYRGAIQEEDEREAARKLLTAMAGRDDWIGYRYPALRAGVRLLPHGADTASAQKVRNMAAALAGKDPGFQRLRVKIHGSPDASDAASVRDYAAKAGRHGNAAASRSARRRDRPRVRAAPARRGARRERQAPECGAVVAGAVARRASQPWRATRVRRRATERPPTCSPHCATRCRSWTPGRHACACSNCRSRSRRRTSGPRRSCAAGPPRRPVATTCACSRSGVEAAYGSGTINARERAESRKAFAATVVEPGPPGDLPARASLPRPPARMGHAGPAAALRRGDGEARRDRTARGAVHTGPAARQPAAVLLADPGPAVAGREPACRRAAQAPRQGHRRRLQRAESRARARRPAFRAGHEARRRIPARRHLRASRDGGRPAAARGDPDRRRREPTVACPASRAQPGNPERRGRRIPAAGTARERRQAHRARRQPGRPGADQRRRSALGCRLRRREEAGAERDVRARPEEARPLEAGVRRARRTPRERLRPHRRAEGGEARRAEVALSGSRRAWRRHPLRAVPGDRARAPVPELGEDRVPVDGRELSQARGDARRVGRSRGVRREAARGDLLDRARHRPGQRSSVRACARRWRGPSVRGSRAASSCARTPMSRTCPASPAPD